MRIKASIIIASINNEANLKKTLDSVVKQTLSDIEIIVVSNKNILIETYLDDKRLKYFEKEGLTKEALFNFGIRKSHGDYLCFLEEGETFYSDFIMKMYDKMFNENLDLVVCNYYDIEAKGSIKLDYFENTNVLNNGQIISLLNHHISNKMYHRTLLYENILFRENMADSYLVFSLETIINSDKIGLIIDELVNINFSYKKNIAYEKPAEIFKMFDMMRTTFEQNRELQKYFNEVVIRELITYNLDVYHENINNNLAFVDKTFLYLKKNISNYKKSAYFNEIAKVKRLVAKNKILTKIYIKWVKYRYYKKDC